MAAHQAPPSLGFSRQEHWSGLPFPSPGDLPNWGFEPRSPALQADSLPSEPPGNQESNWFLYVNLLTCNLAINACLFQRLLFCFELLVLLDFLQTGIDFLKFSLYPSYLYYKYFQIYKKVEKSKRLRRLDSLESTQWAPRHTRRDSRAERLHLN